MKVMAAKKTFITNARHGDLLWLVSLLKVMNVHSLSCKRNLDEGSCRTLHSFKHFAVRIVENLAVQVQRSPPIRIFARHASWHICARTFVHKGGPFSAALYGGTSYDSIRGCLCDSVPRAVLGCL